MATQFSTLLKLALPVQGELAGTWGDLVNNSVTNMIEEAIAGSKTINTWSTNSATLSTADGATAESRAAILNLTDTGTSLSGAATVICPALTKTFIVKNGTAQTVTIKTASGTGVAIPSGSTGHVYCDGTNVVESQNYVAGNFGVGGNLTVTGTTTFNGGTVTLGDANTDNIVFGGEVDSNIIPDDDGAYDLGSSSKEWKDIYIDGVAYLDAINFNGTAITATAAELNILDGVTSTAAELNILDGVTSTAAELNILDGVTATTAELNYSDTGASVGTVVASKVVTVDANKDVASFRNITLTGELDAGSLDISGDADIDGTLEADAITVNGTALNTVIAGVTVSNATLASTVTVTDSTANTNFPVVFHDESNALLDDTGALRYNPSTGELLVPKLTVAGTTTTVDTVTMNAQNAIVFEGATADAHETTLTIVDPTADRTINLPNQSGTVPVLAAASNTAITSTPEELNILDGVTSTAAELNILDGVTSTAAELNILDGVTSTAAELNILDGVTSTTAELNILDGVTATTAELNYSDTGAAVGTVVASKVVTADANKDVSSFRNITLTGELDAGSLDVSGDADIDGTLEADAITVNGTALNTVIANEATALAIALG